VPPGVPVTPLADTPTVTGTTVTEVLTATDLGLAIVETGVRMPVFAEAPIAEADEFERPPLRAPRQDRN